MNSPLKGVPGFVEANAKHIFAPPYQQGRSKNISGLEPLALER